MLNRFLNWLTHRAYRAGFADGYEAGRRSRNRQEYVQGYADGKRDGLAEREGTERATRRTLQAEYERGQLDERARWALGYYERADASAESYGSNTTAA